MGKKRSKKGSGRGGGRKGSSPREKRGGHGGRGSDGDRGSGGAPKRAGTGDETPGTARLLLTRLLREGAIWEVRIASSAGEGASNITRLEFEGTVAGRGKERYTRPVEGSLLEALHSGAPVSRAALAEELEAAVREAGHEVAPGDADAGRAEEA